MARVRLLQLHQEQQQHRPVVTGQSVTTGTSTAATTTAATSNQWLDLVPSNPILPQIALPGTPSSAVQMSSHHHHNNYNNNNNVHQHQDENGGSSSTESAHQARSGKLHGQPSKIPVVKPLYSAPRPPSSYREHHLHSQARDPYPSWNKCKSDQSLPRNCDPINGYKSGGGGSSIGSGGKQRWSGAAKQDSLQDGAKQHRARRDSANSGGASSLTRAKSQNHHHQRAATVNSATAAKDHRSGGGVTVITATEDTNKVRPTKRFANILNSWIRKS